MKKTERTKQIALYITLIIMMVLILIPIYWTVTSSLKQRIDIISAPTLFPALDRITLNNYYQTLIYRGVWRNILNSFIIAAGNMLLVTACASLASYAFSRYRFKGDRNLFLWTIMNRLLPPAAFLVPFFVLFETVHLVDTHIGLIIIYSLANLPFAMWLLKGFFDAVPKDLDEAALIDGCTQWRLLREVIFPIIKPGLAITAIMVFLFSWNEFLFATSLTRLNAVTIQTTFSGYAIEMSGARWEELYALATTAMIPGVALLYIFSRHIVAGLTLGAVKE